MTVFFVQKLNIFILVSNKHDSSLKQGIYNLFSDPENTDS